jgi:hypothetical protein
MKGKVLFFSEEKAEARPAEPKDFYFSAASTIEAMAGCFHKRRNKSLLLLFSRKEESSFFADQARPYVSSMRTISSSPR